MGRRIVSSRISATELVGEFALLAWIIAPFLRTDRFVTGFDTVAYAGPNLVLTLEEARDGRLAFWNDRIFGGVPHLANPQAGALYPLKFIFTFVEAHRALLLIVALHLVILGAGAHVLARRTLRLAPPAGFVSLAIVAGGGLAATKSLQFEQILVIAWIPWMMVAAAWCIVTRAAKAMVTMAVITALMLTAGHPQLVYVALPLVGVWAVGRARDAKSFAGLGVAVASGVAGVILAAPQLLPTLALTQDAAIGSRSLASASSAGHAVFPSALVQTVLGDLFTANPTFTALAFEPVVFVGVLGATLGAVALVIATRAGPHRATLLLLSIASVLGMLLSFGPRVPLYRAAHAVIPGFNLARVPARWTVVVVFSFAVLAAVGTDALRQGLRRREAAAPALVIAVIIFAGLIPSVNLPGSRTLLTWGTGALIVIVGALIVVRLPRTAAFVSTSIAALVGVELCLLNRGAPYRTNSAPVPFTRLTGPVTEFLAGRPERVLSLTFDRIDNYPYLVTTLRPNTNVIHGIRSVDGYDGGVQVTDRWVEFISPFALDPVNPELNLRSQIALPLDAENLSRAGVRWAVVETEVLPAATQVPGWLGPLRREGTVELWENPAYEGVAWLEGEDDAVPLDIVARSPGRVTVDVGGTGGTVRIAEQFDEGWTAAADGTPIDVVPMNEFFVAGVAPPGTDIVTFAYRPRLFVEGLAVTGAVAFVFGIASSGAALRARGRRHVAETVGGAGT